APAPPGARAARAGRPGAPPRGSRAESGAAGRASDGQGPAYRPIRQRGTWAHVSKNRTSTAILRIRVHAMWRKRWVRLAALALAIPTVIFVLLATYSYVRFAHLIDARLHGERETVFPRILARPLELRRGQSLTERQLIDRLNDLGYPPREQAEKPGEFAIGNGAVAIMPRGTEFKHQVVRVVFQRPAAPAVKPAAARRGPPPRPPDRVQRLELGNRASERL